MPSNKPHFNIQKRQLDIMIGRLTTSNLANSLLACIFAYYYWDSASHTILLAWLIFHIVTTVLKSVFVYPRYQSANIHEGNLRWWQNWFTFTLFTNGLTWGVGMAWFIVPNDAVLMLVLMFTFFVILLSATLILSAYMQAFYALVVPVTLSLCFAFFAQKEIVQVEAIIVFIMFSLINFRFARTEHNDITNLITLQFEKEGLAQKLEQSVEEKNRFLAAASHDLRQPLHASGLLLSALNDHVSTKAGKQLLGDISMSMQALSDSFGSLLDMSKLDAGVIETDIEHFSLSELIQGVCNDFSSQAKDKNIELSFSGDEIAVLSDSIQLERIIRNLVSNAVTYTQKGIVNISWVKQSDLVVELVIKDTGIGIHTSELDNIFSEYYQVDNPERDRNKGFGLGLAIVKRLCDLLSFKIAVDSEIDKGTTFKLSLPIGDIVEVKDKGVVSASTGNLSGFKLLVIDDDLTVLNSMNALLSNWGCKVFCAENDEEAIQVLSELDSKPDMILADYRLRDNKTGVQACERIFDEFNYEVPVVIITGDTSPERLQSVVSSGYQLLHKPVAAAQLRAFIQHQLMGLI